MKLFDTTNNAILFRFGLGCCLMVFGFLALIQSRKSEGDKDHDDEAYSESKSHKEHREEEDEEGRSEQTSYLLNYEFEEGYWTIAPMGQRPSKLTDIVPGPRVTQKKAAYVSRDQLRLILLHVLQDWKVKLSKDEIQSLLDLKVGEKNLFSESDFKPKTSALNGASKTAPKLLKPKSRFRLEAGLAYRIARIYKTA